GAGRARLGPLSARVLRGRRSSRALRGPLVLPARQSSAGAESRRRPGLLLIHGVGGLSAGCEVNMAKVAVIYVATTRHVLACFTTTADVDAKAVGTDFVGGYIPLRDPNGRDQTVFFPSDSKALDFTVIDVKSAATLAQLLLKPMAFSIKADKSDVVAT